MRTSASMAETAAWGGAGFIVTAFAMSIGNLKALVATILVALILGGLRGVSPRIPAFMFGAGGLLLTVALVNARGPGWRCVVSSGCSEFLDPVPLVALGLAFALAGLVIQMAFRPK